MAKKWHKKHVGTQAGIAVLGFFLVTTILSIPFFQRYQDVLALQTQAIGQAKISFAPASGTTKVGEDREFSVVVSPGSYKVSLVTFTINYDSSRFQPVGKGFVVNSNSFSVTEQQVSSGTIKVTVKGLRDKKSNKQVAINGNIGKLTLRAIGATQKLNPTTVSFTSVSGTSTSSTVGANTNVFSRTNGSAKITILPTSTPAQ